MNIEVIDNHSVAVDLLTGGPVLDAGARGFVFSKWFADRGHKVWAMDPSPDITSLPSTDIRFLKMALVGSPARVERFLDTKGDPGAWSVTETNTAHKISAASISDLMIGFFSYGNVEWDVIKLNIEGSEYDVLDTWPGPIARQIVVSFHEHTPRARGRTECDRLIEKMRQWYTPFNVAWEKRYCCSENYWDVLFIRNDLV